MTETLRTERLRRWWRQGEPDYWRWWLRRYVLRRGPRRCAESIRRVPLRIERLED